MNVAEGLIIDAVRAGVLLYTDRGKLRYKALRTMPFELVQRVRANREDVLSRLNSNEPVYTSGTADYARSKCVDVDVEGDSFVNPLENLSDELRAEGEWIAQVLDDHRELSQVRSSGCAQWPKDCLPRSKSW